MLARADKAAKIGMSSYSANTSRRLASPTTSATAVQRKARVRAEQTAIAAAEQKEVVVEAEDEAATEANAEKEAVYQRQQHKLAQLHATRERARARERARLHVLARERKHEQQAGWVHVRKFVAPWDPCATDAVVTADEAVREPSAMCHDLALIRDASRPRDGLGLLSLIESRPVTPEWGGGVPPEGHDDGSVGNEAWDSVGGGEGVMGVMTRINKKQEVLNRRRLKLYIKVFGAAYAGETSRRASRAAVMHL